MTETSDRKHTKERARARACVLQYGHHATSFQILKPEFSYWFDDQIDGVVGFVRHLKHRIVAGVPVGPQARWPELLRHFVADAAIHGDRVVFFCADSTLVEALEEANLDWDAVQIGLQPEWDPKEYHTRGSDRRSMRSQCNRARNKGVVVRELTRDELAEGTPVRTEIRQLVRQWLDARRMAVMHFVVELTPFEDADDRRYFIAEDQEGIAAFLVATAVPARRGWFFENVIRRSDAPNGAVELLVDQTMRTLGDEGWDYATLGLAPLAGATDRDREHTSSHALLDWLFEMSYRHLGFVYSFHGLYRFKKRMNPDVWAPQYAIRVGGRVGLIAIAAILLAFARRLPHFVAETLRRLARHASVRFWAGAVTVMGGLLIPWTLLLTQVDGERWLGGTTAKHAWIGFDTAMILALAGLVWLLLRGFETHATRLALVLAGLTSVDFALTLHGAVTLETHLSFTAFLLVIAGTVAPLLASTLLYGVARFGVDSG